MKWSNVVLLIGIALFASADYASAYEDSTEVSAPAQVIDTSPKPNKPHVRAYDPNSEKDEERVNLSLIRMAVDLYFSFRQKLKRYLASLTMFEKWLIFRGQIPAIEDINTRYMEEFVENGQFKLWYGLYPILHDGQRFQELTDHYGVNRLATMIDALRGSKMYKKFANTLEKDQFQFWQTLRESHIFSEIGNNEVVLQRYKEFVASQH